jgi:hypothetical protein
LRCRKPVKSWKRSARERFDALVKKGIIDAEGEVLVRMPAAAPESGTGPTVEESQRAAPG